MNTAEYLGSLPLFEGLPGAQLEALAGIVTEQKCDRGRIIFSEGDEGTGFYIIVRGRIKVFKISAEGREQILHIVGPGEPFGEVPVFAGREFPAHAEALQPARLLFFPRRAFVRLIRDNPDLALNMLAVLAERLRRFAAMVEDLSLKEVPGRLAAYLLFLSERQEGAVELELDIRKGQLASLLGTIPETLSRILNRMGKEGVIEMRGARIRLLDLERLQDLADGSVRL